jgi:ATP-dependent exoDNAse (exonuclease V) beta subunit
MITPEPAAETSEMPPLAREAVERAVANAANSPRRVTPHALAVHSPSEAEPEKQAEREEEAEAPAGPGVLYGTWWHELVETIPWDQPREEWQRKFAVARNRSPDRKRAVREWNLFLDSPLAAWLAEPGRLAQIEWPFLWPEAGGRCLEGVMDLAVYSPRDAAWQVIDWKTNRIGADGGAAIVEIYREQVRTYVEALRRMFESEVTGSLYLTQTGAWIAVA